MDDILNKIHQQIHIDAHHAAEEAVNSPQVINRVVGESMRHIAGILENSSSGYLPIQPNEILTEPARVLGNKDAIVLVNRTITSPNSFTLLANAKTVDGMRNFEIYGYQPNNFALSQSKFFEFTEVFGKEIIRQLNKISSKDGMLILQVVVIKNYFKDEVTTEDQLFAAEPDAYKVPAPPSPVPPAPEPKEAFRVTRGVLPDVDHELL